MSLNRTGYTLLRLVLLTTIVSIVFTLSGYFLHVNHLMDNYRTLFGLVQRERQASYTQLESSNQKRNDAGQKYEMESKEMKQWKSFVHQYRKANPFSTDPDDPNPTIYITSYTYLQPDLYRWMSEGETPFKHCPALQAWMKCEYHLNTADHNVLNQSHAVLFHARHMDSSRTNYTGLPSVHKSDQKWIFYESEAPTNVWNYVDIESEDWTHFNLTATFASDSDLLLKNHLMTCKPKRNWQSNGVNHAEGKSKIATWFVSHCDTSSRRELYVEELKKHVQVDIYGKCSKSSTCLRHSFKVEDNAECMFNVIDKDYKFYLSFENAFCSQYVTEKFHEIVRRATVVPVVLGEVDYSNILPEGTFIDVRDFKSPQELAEYLIMLDKNDTLYNQYIEKMMSMDCTISYTFECDLCEYLHIHRYETQLVYDAASFWSPDRRCISPKDFYRNTAPSIIPKINFTSHPEVFL